MSQRNIFIQNGVDAKFDFFFRQLLLQGLTKDKESGAHIVLERSIVIPLPARLGKDRAEMFQLQKEIPYAVSMEGFVEATDSMAVVLKRLRLPADEVVLLLQQGIARHEGMPFAVPQDIQQRQQRQTDKDCGSQQDIPQTVRIGVGKIVATLADSHRVLPR